MFLNSCNIFKSKLGLRTIEIQLITSCVCFVLNPWKRFILPRFVGSCPSGVPGNQGKTLNCPVFMLSTGNEHCPRILKCFWKLFNFHERRQSHNKMCLPWIHVYTQAQERRPWYKPENPYYIYRQAYSRTQLLHSPVSNLTLIKLNTVSCITVSCVLNPTMNPLSSWILLRTTREFPLSLPAFLQERRPCAAPSFCSIWRYIHRRIRIQIRWINSWDNKVIKTAISFHPLSQDNLGISILTARTTTKRKR